MKKAIGIVCEYNPFHAGHRYHIEQSRKMAAENGTAGEEPAVICVMSGDFVQRGEWAILPKHERAEMAVKGGADLVVELPLPWCLSSAEGFASGAVDLLLRLGVTYLSFGSESGDLPALCRAAETVSSAAFLPSLSAYMHLHPELPYPAARAAVLSSCGVDADCLEHPNDLLAVEYLKALGKCGFRSGFGEPVTPLAVRRVGSGHDERKNGDAGPFLSAKALREEMKSAGQGTDGGILDIAAVSRLRELSPEVFGQIDDTANGAGERLLAGVRSGAGTVDAVCLAAKTKSLTFSRLKRIAMRAVLHVTSDLSDGMPPYARVLAMNARGREYLAFLRGTETVPVVIRPKEIAALPEFARRVFAAGAYAEDFYDLGIRSGIPPKCGEDYRRGPCIVGNCEK